MHGMINIKDGESWLWIGKNGRILSERPKPTAGCSANGRSSKINPHKPLKCILYSTQEFLWICIISSLKPPSNACDLWNDV
jgi:hypothetical protein